MTEEHPLAKWKGSMAIEGGHVTDDWQRSEPIGAGKPVFIEHEQNQEGSGVGGAARIKYRSGEEYIRADIAEQMAEALREGRIAISLGSKEAMAMGHAAIDQALAAYEQAKGEGKE